MPCQPACDVRDTYKDWTIGLCHRLRSVTLPSVLSTFSCRKTEVESVRRISVDFQ